MLADFSMEIETHCLAVWIHVLQCSCLMIGVDLMRGVASLGCFDSSTVMHNILDLHPS